MTEYLLGQLKSQRVQHDRPVNRMEAHDFLAHQMHVRRPVFVKQLRMIGAVAQRGNVIGKRVDPNVHHVLGIEIHRHAPLEGCAAHAQILKSGTQEIIQHFVRPRRRLNEIGMAFDVFDQPRRIFAHAEEIALLAHLFGGTAAIGAKIALLELRGRPEGFALRAVLSFIFRFINVALIIELLEDLLNHLFMAFIGRADEIIVFDVHQLP